MILNIDGDINRYYFQTLCLVFFPGSSFDEHEVGGKGVPEVNVKVFFDKDNNVYVGDVSIKLNDKICKATECVSADEKMHIATHSSIAVGRALLAAGRELLGHIPPWGILTGIRPTKVAGSLLTSGLGVVKTKRVLRDEYFLSHQKAALAVTVAQNEMKLIKGLEPNTCSLYISIPFCPSRCSYCSFVSYTTPRLLSMIDDYIEALILDIKETADIINQLGLWVNTIYIGGGTPTTLTSTQLERLMSTLDELFELSLLDEFTLEAGRPDTITADKLDIAKKYGVTRISVNPQTLSDELLRDIGRKHTVSDFYEAYELVRKSGIKDINVDLIAGLPGDDFRNFSETIDKVIELQPTNITVHTFSVKKASDALRRNSSIYSLFGGDTAKSVAYAQLKTKFASYKPYYMYRQKNTVGNLENVGFSLDGHEGLYNVYMMEEIQTIFATGAGAATKLVKKQDGVTNIKRIFRPKYPYEYLRDFDISKREDGSSSKEKIRKQILDFFK